LARLGRSVEAEGRLTSRAFINILLILMLCCWFTDFIGLYAVFGAFILGAVMPRGPLVAALRGHLELITVHLLLPLFFVYSGLNTRVGLINSAPLLLIAAGLITIAIVGKLAGCALAARAAGEEWREAITIGVLMNARGLMELIILNIGLQQGIITPVLFTMMVMMAIVTTLMASPLFELVYGRHLRRMPGETAAVAART
jgi:Kef-type K+ transport system membrane component KefB